MLYRTNENQCWSKYNIDTVIELENIGDYVQFQNTSERLGKFSENGCKRVQFVMSGRIDASGNIQSLLNYRKDCPNWSFIYLFKNCESLISTPEMPATKLGDYCYDEMYSGCSNLKYASKLPASEIPGAAYQAMFKDCINLLKVPKTPKITKIAGSGMHSMFWGCKTIEYGIDIDAYRAEGYCCTYMYHSCIKLNKMPKLNSTILDGYCFMQMFQNCINLKEAELLNATTLGKKCCENMFNGCSSLKSVKVNFTDWQWENENYATNYWLYNISKTGTFTKPSGLPEEYGVSYIPSGWIVENI